MVREDIKPSDILTREAFENAIVANTAVGGSTNAPVHLIAMAKHIGVPLNCDDWEKIGYKIPLLVNVQPAGEWLCEEYHRAGGLPGKFNPLPAFYTYPLVMKGFTELICPSFSGDGGATSRKSTATSRYSDCEWQVYARELRRKGYLGSSSY